jgi:hypothetical protein
MSYGQKIRPRRCPESELIALGTLMIIQGRDAFARGIPCILNKVPIVNL